MNREHTQQNKRNKRTSPKNPQKVFRGASPKSQNNVPKATVAAQVASETPFHKRGKKNRSANGANNKVAKGNGNAEHSPSQRRQTGQAGRRNHKGNNHHELYDIFGDRVQNKLRNKSSNKSYRPEYCPINLPQKPEDLVCGICNQTISDNVELLEALEILTGEFFTQADDVPEQTSAHFQCVLKILGESAQLAAGESVAYVGAGQFAVVQSPQRIVKRMLMRSEWSQNSSLSPTNWANWRQDMSSHTLLATLSIKTDV